MNLNKTKFNQKEYNELDFEIQRFLDKFPNNAKSWGQATDELSTLASEILDYYNEYVLDAVRGERGYVSFDARLFGTPSRHNTTLKAIIAKYYGKLSERHKDAIYDQYSEWFEGAVGQRIMGERKVRRFNEGYGKK